MKALVLVAHGSRRKQSNDEVVDLATKLKQHCKNEYTMVQAGFLELALPSIPESIQKCIDAGATEVTVLPYFLNSGRHVVEDIPNEVNHVKANNPKSDIKIAQHLGASELMMDLLISSASVVR